jgi:hypothetical protein
MLATRCVRGAASQQLAFGVYQCMYWYMHTNVRRRWLDDVKVTVTDLWLLVRWLHPGDPSAP